MLKCVGKNASLSLEGLSSNSYIKQILLDIFVLSVTKGISVDSFVQIWYERYSAILNREPW